MVVREGQAVDLLATREDLHRWLEAERRRLGDCAFAIAHLDEIRALRDAVRSLLAASAHGTAPLPEALEHLNAASAAAPMAPELEVGIDGELRMVERATVGDALAQLLARLALSAITLVTRREGERLQVCEAPSCGMFFLGSRRWCCGACGNRARAARHYRRTRARATPESHP